MKCCLACRRPTGTTPVKLPSSALPTRSVTPAVRCLMTMRVLVARHLGLGQAAVVERDHGLARLLSVGS